LQAAALTGIGFFWMAPWAFALGYLISGMIQILVTRFRMQRTMGTSGPRSIALGTFFGFISISCSHGFDIAGPGIDRREHPGGGRLLPEIDRGDKTPIKIGLSDKTYELPPGSGREFALKDDSNQEKKERPHGIEEESGAAIPQDEVCQKAPEWAEHARLGDDDEPCDDGRTGNLTRNPKFD